MLVHKDEEAIKNIGDPPSLMNVYDVDAEEAKTANAMQQDMTPEDFESRVLTGESSEDMDLLSFLEQSQEAPREGSSQERLTSMSSLFMDDWEYFTSALYSLGQYYEMDSQQRVLEMNITEDLAHRFRFLPKEIQPRDGYLKFTDNKDIMQEEIRRCRKDDKAWPNLHFLWPLHPAMEWVNDKVQTNFNRHVALVISLPTLNAEEIIYLLTGIIPNRKGQPLIQRWFGIFINKGTLQAIEPLETVLARSKIADRTFSNPGDFKVGEKAKELLPDVIQKAQGHMKEARKEFEDRIKPQLNE